MLASELKILKAGMKFQVLEDMYNADIDSLVSDKIDTNAFNGMLNAVYLEKELFQIIRNISKILDRGEKISKNDNDRSPLQFCCGLFILILLYESVCK